VGSPADRAHRYGRGSTALGRTRPPDECPPGLRREPRSQSASGPPACRGVQGPERFAAAQPLENREFAWAFRRISHAPKSPLAVRNWNPNDDPRFMQVRQQGGLISDVRRASELVIAQPRHAAATVRPFQFVGVVPAALEESAARHGTDRVALIHHRRDRCGRDSRVGGCQRHPPSLHERDGRGNGWAGDTRRHPPLLAHTTTIAARARAPSTASCLGPGVRRDERGFGGRRQGRRVRCRAGRHDLANATSGSITWPSAARSASTYCFRRSAIATRLPLPQVKRLRPSRTASRSAARRDRRPLPFGKG